VGTELRSFADGFPILTRPDLSLVEIDGLLVGCETMKRRVELLVGRGLYERSTDRSVERMELLLSLIEAINDVEGLIELIELMD
jgi:hypothetical protein